MPHDYGCSLHSVLQARLSRNAVVSHSTLSYNLLETAVAALTVRDSAPLARPLAPRGELRVRGSAAEARLRGRAEPSAVADSRVVDWVTWPWVT